MKLYCTEQGRDIEVVRNDDMTLYVCGVTPYDSAHTGHLAMAIVYDVIARRLRTLGVRVRVVRNITDVDDPLLPRALQLNIPYWDLVETEIAQWTDDTRRLNLTCDVEPRASEHIDGMISAIEGMAAAGLTYVIDGTLYLRVSKDRGFGGLSHFDEPTMLEAARARGGDPDRPGKEHPLDFIMWQPARAGEPEYDSPFGRGRPGWHIGCSVMSNKHCGPRVDIHGGGADLVFPHHECEAAQDRALGNDGSVGIWFHSALLDYRGAKMSKSRGNIVLARDLLAEHHPMVVRLASMTDYSPRRGGEWRDGCVDEAAERFARWTRAAAADAGPDPARFEQAFFARLDDNVELPDAVRVVDELADEVLAGRGTDVSAPRTVRSLMDVLGLTG